MITLPNVDPSMIANNLMPFEPTHPGELIRDELEERNLTQAKTPSHKISEAPGAVLGERFSRVEEGAMPGALNEVF